MSEASTARQHHAVIEVTADDLPLCCPNAKSDVAPLHPRVYIALDKSTGRGVCSYCGAEYQLRK
jgi:uncharacterized Zn-finger protein